MYCFLFWFHCSQFSLAFVWSRMNRIHRRQRAQAAAARRWRRRPAWYDRCLFRYELFVQALNETIIVERHARQERFSCACDRHFIERIILKCFFFHDWKEKTKQTLFFGFFDIKFEYNRIDSFYCRSFLILATEALTLSITRNFWISSWTSPIVNRGVNGTKLKIHINS